jgi:protein required for attachment to host cells
VISIKSPLKRPCHLSGRSALSGGRHEEIDMKAKVTWILIADGAQARVLQNDGPGKGLSPVKGLTFEQEPLKNREIVTDRQGRSFSSVGHGRSAYEPDVSPVEQREQRFVERVAEELDERRRNGDFDRLIIAADPTSLGNIRGSLSKQVQDAVVAELPKDLTNIPTPKLGSHFADVLAV